MRLTIGVTIILFAVVSWVPNGSAAEQTTKPTTQPSTSPASQTSTQPAAWNALEEALGAWPGDPRRKAIVKEGCHIAYSTTVDNKEAVVLDGKVGPTFDRIDNIVLSPDGKHLAYGAGIKGKGQFLVIDGQQSATSYASFDSLTYSPDNRLAYTDHNDSGWVVVVDGKVATPGYPDQIEPKIIFTPDGKHMAYIVNFQPNQPPNSKKFLVLDGKPQPKFGWIDPYELMFSADGKHVVYAAKEGEKWRAVLDGEVSGANEGTNDTAYFTVPRISPDGKRLAYVGNVGSKQGVIVDGKPGPAFDRIDGAPVFSADGKHVGYWGRTGIDTMIAVVDGQRVGDEAAYVNHLVFSPDGRHTAYSALKNNSARPFVVLDGKGGPQFTGISMGPIFSPDSKRLVYAAYEGEKYFVVDDGQSGTQYDGVARYSLQFSPDGKHLTVVAIRGKKGSQKQLLVTDSHEGPEFDLILVESLNFRSDGSIQYLAVRKDTLFRVTQTQQR